jgi:hypothetical protein
MPFNLFRLFRSRSEDPNPSTESFSGDEDVQNPVARELALHLAFEGAVAERVELFDMNIRGARILVPFQVAPEEAAGQAVLLDVAHESGSWRVEVHATVTQLSLWNDSTVMLEVEFTRLGELYAQLDNALGRYFNRRVSGRVAPAQGERIGVRLAYGPHRVRGLASDLSSTGICARAPLVQAAVFHLGERVKAFIDLPGRGEEIEVPGVVKHGYRHGEDVHLGIEFDLSVESGMTARRTEFLRYIDARRKAGGEISRQALRRA